MDERRKTLAEIEKDAILSAMAHHCGDKKAVAKELGIALKTLYNKLNRYEWLESMKGFTE